MKISEWLKAKRSEKAFFKNLGLTKEESTEIKEDLRRGDSEKAEKKIARAQEKQKKKLKEAGIDIDNIVPVIGKEISWTDIVQMVFRVLEFDRSDTKMPLNGQPSDIKAGSLNRPYGYLLVEAPTLNQPIHLPIIHRDDFWLATTVFDEPQFSKLVTDEELLVTYAPKHTLHNGFSGSPHHVLHYVITPKGTLDSYYSMNNDIHMAKPEPQKLFGPFVYEGEIRVEVNLEPKL